MPEQVLDDHYFGLSAIVTVGMQLVFFFIAFFLQIDKVRLPRSGLRWCDVQRFHDPSRAARAACGPTHPAIRLVPMHADSRDA